MTVLWLGLMVGSVHAQITSVSGTVRDEMETLIGATVCEVDATGRNINATITDFNGHFAMKVKSTKNKLKVSFMGYKTQTLPINRTVYNITLESAQRVMKEVSVVSKKRLNSGGLAIPEREVSFATQTISTKEFEGLGITTVDEALQGRIAGLDIISNSGNLGSGTTMRLRGTSSISTLTNQNPLIVVNGNTWNVDMSTFDINSANDETFAQLLNVNPEDIEEISVLKDAAATAIYGSQGANGVIEIKTKRGKRGAPAVSYSLRLTGTYQPEGYKMLTGDEYTMLLKESYFNPEQSSTASNIPELNYDPTFSEYEQYNNNTDWQDEAYQTAINHNHQVSIRGGADKTLYSVHLGYMHKDALMRNGFLDRYSGRINLDSQLRDWLKMGANMSFNYNKGNDNYKSYGVKRLVQEAIPLIPVKYPDGSWGSNRDFPGAVQDTPSRYLEEMVNETSNIQTIADLYLDFKITDDLNFKSTFAVDASNRKRNYYSGKDLIQFSKTAGGIATIETLKEMYWQNENYFNYNKEFNKNNRMNVMLGASWQQRVAESVEATSQNFSDDFYQWHNLGAGTVTIPSKSEDYGWSINSYFARINYTLKDRYLFTATGRYDGSSKFGKNNKYAFFPSFAFAWRASEESFLKGVNWLNNLKVRTSIGETGNQEIGNYAFYQKLGSENTIFGNDYYTALYRSTFGNPDLKWEKTLQWDAGVDVSVLNQRIDLSLDYYYKKTSDLLLEAPIPGTSGLNTIMRNIGSVQNQGFELTLNTHNIQTDNFNWMSTVLFNVNRNKILNLGENDEDIYPKPRHAQGDMLILRVGEPVGSLWGLRRLGTWGEDEAAEAAKYNRLPGDVKYEDLNGDGKINSEDNTIIGCTSPDWTMTISNTFLYKNFDFSFDLRFVFGNDVVNCATHNAEDRSGVANGFKSNLNAWTPQNQHTMVAQRRPMKSYYDSYPDSHWMQNGSFVRGQNFVLGYTFSKSLLQKIKLQDLRIYASAQNLFCITKYKGYDPEVTTYEDAAFGQGIDDFSEPKARTFTFGLNVKF